MKKVTSLRISFNDLRQMNEKQLYDMVCAVSTYCENGRDAADAGIARLTADPLVAVKFEKYRRRIDRAEEQSRKAAEKRAEQSECSEVSGGSGQPEPAAGLVDSEGERVCLPVEMRAVPGFTMQYIDEEIELLYGAPRNPVTIRFLNFLKKFRECVCPYMPSMAEALQTGARRGDISSQCELGECYEFGRHGLSRDREKALYWYRKAAPRHISARMALDRMEGRRQW